MIPSTTGWALARADKKDDRIPALVADLASTDPVRRTKARKGLVAVGKPAVPSLISLLAHRKPHLRWEAAKALCGIADPISALALVNALDDDDSDVRWLAAEGLVALGREAVLPLLAALLEQACSPSFCKGAHHVCHALVKRKRLGPYWRL